MTALDTGRHDQDGQIGRVVGTLSGGTGSWAAVRRWVDQHGSDNLTLVFTDTLIEDQDAYRFLIAGAANLFGIILPDGFVPEIADFPAWEDRPAYKAFVLGLAARTMMLMPGLQWLSDGRDIWDVFEQRRFLGNTHRDVCSETLKRKPLAAWLKSNCTPGKTTIIFGIDHEEEHRFFGNHRSVGIRKRYADKGWTAVAPLCEEPYWFPPRIRERLANARLWLPRLNALGFAHNNCGGPCCKAGQGHWKDVHRLLASRYDYSELREQQIRDLLGDVSMLTDRRGGKGKRPLTLTALRERDLTPLEASDKGGCGCFFGDMDDLFAPATPSRSPL